MLRRRSCSIRNGGSHSRVIFLGQVRLTIARSVCLLTFLRPVSFYPGASEGLFYCSRARLHLRSTSLIHCFAGKTRAFPSWRSHWIRVQSVRSRLPLAVPHSFGWHSIRYWRVSD